MTYILQKDATKFHWATFSSEIKFKSHLLAASSIHPSSVIFSDKPVTDKSESKTYLGSEKFLHVVQYCLIFINSSRKFWCFRPGQLPTPLGHEPGVIVLIPYIFPGKNLMKNCTQGVPKMRSLYLKIYFLSFWTAISPDFWVIKMKLFFLSKNEIWIISATINYSFWKWFIHHYGHLKTMILTLFAFSRKTKDIFRGRFLINSYFLIWWVFRKLAFFGRF